MEIFHGARLFRGKGSTVENYSAEKFHSGRLFRGKRSTVEDYFAEIFHGGPNWVASVKVRRWNDQSRAEQVTIVPISNFHRSTIRRKSTGSSANRLKLREIGQF